MYAFKSRISLIHPIYSLNPLFISSSLASFGCIDQRVTQVLRSLYLFFCTLFKFNLEVFVKIILYSLRIVQMNTDSTWEIYGSAESIHKWYFSGSNWQNYELYKPFYKGTRLIRTIHLLSESSLMKKKNWVSWLGRLYIVAKYYRLV